MVKAITLGREEKYGRVGKKGREDRLNVANGHGKTNKKQ